MSGLEWDTIALLTGTAFLAGFIDSIAGGGGLLTVPALLIAGVDVDGGGDEQGARDFVDRLGSGHLWAKGAH